MLSLITHVSARFNRSPWVKFADFVAMFSDTFVAVFRDIRVRLPSGLRCFQSARHMRESGFFQVPSFFTTPLFAATKYLTAWAFGLYPNPTLIYVGEHVFVDVAGNKDSPDEFKGGVVLQVAIIWR